jgi:hypothetical protein
VLHNGTVVGNTNYNKTTQNTLTYTGISLASTTVEVRRFTPVGVIQTVTYGQKFSSELWNSELDRKTRWQEEVNLNGAGNVISVPLPQNDPFGIVWSTDTFYPPTRKSVFDYVNTLAPKDGANLTNATATTPAITDNDTSIATTEYVKNNLANYAPLNSPTFTGNVNVPNRSQADSSGRAANTLYVDTGLALKAGVSDVNAALNLKAPLDSPVFTGNPTVPTASASDNDTTIANTEHVKNAIALAFGWDSLSLLNSYVAVNNLQYAKHPSGIIFIRGNLTRSSINDNTTIATLPVGCRPSVNMLFAVPCNTNTITTIARISITTAGNIDYTGNITTGGTSIALLQINLSFITA